MSAVNISEVVRGLVEMKRYRGPGEVMEVMTDEGSADRLRKALARQLWYYRRHCERRKRWLLRKLRDEIEIRSWYARRSGVGLASSHRLGMTRSAMHGGNEKGRPQ